MQYTQGARSIPRDKLTCIIIGTNECRVCVRMYMQRVVALIALLVSMGMVAVSLTMDTIGFLHLTYTDFTKCNYTAVEAVLPCNITHCGLLAVPAASCYCCYILEEWHHCTIQPLTRHYFFSGVHSCEQVSVTLYNLQIGLLLVHILWVGVCCAHCCMLIQKPKARRTLRRQDAVLTMKLRKK